jgi:hypothetical protein
VVVIAGLLDCVGAVSKSKVTVCGWQSISVCEKNKGPEQSWEGGLLHME